MPVDNEKVKAFITLPIVDIYVEVGVYTGKGITNIANSIPTIGKLIGVDSYKAYVDEFMNYGEGPDSTVNRGYANSNYAVSAKQSAYNKTVALNRIAANPHHEKIQVLEMDSIDAAQTFNDNSIDIVFLDAYTNIQRAHADVKAWFPKVKVNGILSGQSWHPVHSIVPEIKKALNDLGYTSTIQTDGIFWYIRKEA